MKEKRKIIAMVLLVITMITIVTNVSYGFGISDLTGTQKEVAALTGAGNKILTVITTIGIVISVVMLIVLGIKYMIGSTEEKAEYKKSLMPYVIGAGILFAASSIAQIIYTLAIKI